MIDLILDSAIGGKAKGIRAVPLSSLRNFRKALTPQEAKAAARQKGALLYSPAYDFDDGVLQSLSSCGGAMVFAFSDLLSESGFRRAIMLSKMRLALSSCKGRGAGAIVCTLAGSGAGMRCARELSAFQFVLGMNPHEQAHSDSLLLLLAGAHEKKGAARAGQLPGAISQKVDDK